MAVIAFCFLELASAVCVAEQKIGSLQTIVTTDYSYPTCTLTAPTDISLGTKIAGSGLDDAQPINFSISCDENVPSRVKVLVAKGSKTFRDNEVSFINSQGVDSSGGITALFFYNKSDMSAHIFVDGSIGFCNGDSNRTCNIYTLISAQSQVDNPTVTLGKATAAIKLNLEYD